MRKHSQTSCDDLLTPITKLAHPRCLLCGSPTEVAHHFVHKSKCNALRYYFRNLIPLCHRDHQALHHNESLYAARIVRILGIEWFNEIEEIKNRSYVKTDWVYYNKQHNRLSKILKKGVVEPWFLSTPPR